MFLICNCGLLFHSHYLSAWRRLSLGSCSVWRWGCSARSIWWLRHVIPPWPCLWNYAGLYSIFSPLLESPLLSVIAPKQRCHLPILSQIWKHVYLCETATGLSLWRKTLSCPVCLCAVKKWSIMKNDKEKLFWNTSWGWRRVWDHNQWDLVFSSACMEENQSLQWWSQDVWRTGEKMKISMFYLP